jgi:8-oxo-dGTP diphosphatase
MLLNMKETRPKVGVAVFVFQDSKVLLGKRKGAHGSGNWALPGGHLEFGESVIACAKRELAEETGLQAHLIQADSYSNDVIDKTKHYVTLFATVHSFEGSPQLLEPNNCEGWQWFPINALPTPLFPPVLTYFQKHISMSVSASDLENFHI